MLYLDFAIIVLLFTTIFYLWRMNRKIVELRNYKSEFIELIGTFDDSILKAESFLDEMKTINNKSFQHISEKYDKAKYIADDLAFLTDRACDLADKLDDKIKEARKADNLLPRSNPFPNINQNPKNEIKKTYNQPQRPENNQLKSFNKQEFGAEDITQHDDDKMKKNLHLTKEAFKSEDKETKKKAIQSLLERISSSNKKGEKIS